jgi:hypothetical protein
MLDANEEIVRRYFELRGYFVRTNIPYRFRTDKGAGWSDIDLCVLHPRSGDAAAVEVKGWHTEAITPSSLRDWPRLFYFVRPEATAVISELLGRDDFRRVLVVSRLGERGRAEVIDYARERGVEIMEFAAILEDLIANTPLDRSAGSDAEHMIRVLKTYGFVASSSSLLDDGHGSP